MEPSRWSVSRADDKDTGSVSFLPLALLMLPLLLSGLTDSLLSGRVKLSACPFTPMEPHTPQPHTQTPIHLSQPFLTLIQIPESKSPSWCLQRKFWYKRIWSAGTQAANTGHQTKAPATRRLRAEAKCWSVSEVQETSRCPLFGQKLSRMECPNETNKV